MVILFVGIGLGILAREAVVAWAAILPAAVCVAALGRVAISNPLPLFLLGFAFGMVRVPPADTAGPLVRQSRAILEGDVLDISLSPPPERGVLTLRTIRVNGITASGGVRVSVQSSPRIEAGTRVRLFVSDLRAIRPPTNPGQPDFARLWARQGIVASARLDHAESVDPSPGARTFLARVRLSLRDRFYRDLPPEEAGLMSGLILGFKEGVPTHLSESLRRTGTMHLLVISGMHFVLVMAGIGFFVRAAIPTRAWSGVALAWGVVYAGMAGLSVPVLRALTMIVLYWGASVIRRRPDALNILGATGALALAIEPADLFSLSFQLTFLAVLGIIVVAPRLQSKEGKRGWLYGLATSTAISVGCTLTTMPVIAHHFGVVTPSVCVANLLIGPLATASILAGFAALGLGGIPVVGEAAAFATCVCTRLLGTVAEVTAELPGGTFSIVPPAVGWVLAYYVGLGIWCLRPSKSLALLLPLPLLLPHFMRQEEDRLLVLDVPDGISAVVHRDGRTVAFSDVRSSALRNYLASKGIESVDLFVWCRSGDPPISARVLLRPEERAATVRVDDQSFEIRTLPASRWGRAGSVGEATPILSWSEGESRVGVLGPKSGVEESILQAEGLRFEISAEPGTLRVAGEPDRFTSRQGAVIWKPPR